MCLHSIYHFLFVSSFTKCIKFLSWVSGGNTNMRKTEFLLSSLWLLQGPSGPKEVAGCVWWPRIRQWRVKTNCAPSTEAFEFISLKHRPRQKYIYIFAILVIPTGRQFVTPHETGTLKTRCSKTQVCDRGLNAMWNLDSDAGHGKAYGVGCCSEGTKMTFRLFLTGFVAFICA